MTWETGVVKVTLFEILDIDLPQGFVECQSDDPECEFLLVDEHFLEKPENVNLIYGLAQANNLEIIIRMIAWTVLPTKLRSKVVGCIDRYDFDDLGTLVEEIKDLKGSAILPE